jgi:hypothetical protein
LFIDETSACTDMHSGGVSASPRNPKYGIEISAQEG